MKKTVLFTAALLTTALVSAQSGEITSNRGENWLSQDGDWGLTFDANPLLNYAGNLFNGTANNNIGGGLWWANSAYAIQGKKLINANTAYRGMVRIGFGSNKNTVTVASQVTPNTYVENDSTRSHFNVNLAFGIEKRVGSTRVVGVYGAMANIGLGSSKTAYTYGDAIQAGQLRVTENKDGSTFGFGINVFAGVEWFVAPKISLGGEYTWGLGLSSTGYGSQSYEVGTGATAPTNTNTGVKNSNFSLDTGISGGRVNVNFYFQ